MNKRQGWKKEERERPTILPEKRGEERKSAQEEREGEMAKGLSGAYCRLTVILLTDVTGGEGKVHRWT